MQPQQRVNNPSHAELTAMADILTQCPATGRTIPTGLKTDWIVFETLPDVEVPVPLRCPECGKLHRWRPSFAWVDGSAPRSTWQRRKGRPARLVAAEEGVGRDEDVQIEQSTPA